MQHPTAELGKLVGALALLARDEAETAADLAGLQTAVAEGSHAEAVESAFAALGFCAQRVTVLGCPDDALVLRRPDEASSCTFLFHPGPPAASAARAVMAPGSPRDALDSTRGIPGLPGQLAACLAALRAAERAGLALAFTPGVILAPHAASGDLWPGLRPLFEAGAVEGEVACFDGVAVPRLWPGCFGTLEVLIRVRGRAAHPGAPGRGLNAIEAGLPVLQALTALGRSIARRGVGLARCEPDAPLRARLTLAAVHGGQRGSSLATVFDVLVNRRYTPAERYDDVMAELEATARDALAASPAPGGEVPGVEVQVTHHTAPVPDPLGARRPRAEAALSFALGWPHEVLRLDPAQPDPDWDADRTQARPNAVLLGGVARATEGEADEPAIVQAQARAILAYLAADFRPGLAG